MAAISNTGHVGDVDVELWQQEQELLALQRGLEGTDVDTLLQQRIQVARSKIEAMSKIVSE